MDNRILACDLDGVIFKFNDRYAEIIKQMHGIDLGKETNEYPTVWYWERAAGVTKEQEALVWKWINGIGNYDFWRFLPAYEDAKEFLSEAFSNFNDIYFITARSGDRCKKATEDALKILGVNKPQVIIAKDKVSHLIGIGATDFLDDRDKNHDDILNHGEDTVRAGYDPYVCRQWLLDRPWNRTYNREGVIRVKQAKEIFQNG